MDSAAAAGPAGSSRLAAWVRRAWETPSIMVGLASMPLLAFLCVTPMLRVLQQAFSYQAEDALRADVAEGTPTLEFAREVVASEVSKNLFWQPLLNSVLTGAGATLLAVVIGGLFAWLLTRTDIPGKRVLQALALIPYITPPWPIALAWIAFFQTDAMVGGKPGILQWLTGLKTPIWICFGAFPVIVVEAVHLYAYAFLQISAALTRIDATLEESAETLGLTRWQTLRKVTLPLTLPAILSAAILTFGKAAGNFSTPFFVGNPVKFYTIATRLFEQAHQGQAGRAAFLAIALMLLSAVTLEMNRRAIGQARRFGTVTGKGFRSQLFKLRGLRAPLFATVALLVLVTAAAPLAILLLQSFSREEGVYSLANFTLQFWTGGSDPAFAGGEPGILRSGPMWLATWGSIKLAVVAAGLTVVVALPLAYCIHEKKSPGVARTIEIMTFVPYMTPGLAFGAVYLMMFAKPIGPLPSLYNTFALLVLVTLAKDIPYAVRVETAALSQVAGELTDAARIMGVSSSLLFRKILMPLLSPSLVAAFIVLMIGNMKELSLIILLVGPNTQILTTYVYRYQELGHRGFSAAMVVFLVAVVLSISAFVRWLKSEGMTEGADS